MVLMQAILSWIVWDPEEEVVGAWFGLQAPPYPAQSPLPSMAEPMGEGAPIRRMCHVAVLRAAQLLVLQEAHRRDLSLLLVHQGSVQFYHWLTLNILTET